jgi:hypothetical protein
MPHGWDGEAVTIRWTSSTPLLRKMLMASRLPTRRGPTASQKNRLPGPQWSPHFAAGLGRGYRPGLTGLREAGPKGTTLRGLSFRGLTRQGPRLAFKGRALDSPERCCRRVLLAGPPGSAFPGLGRSTGFPCIPGRF